MQPCRNAVQKASLGIHFPRGSGGQASLCIHRGGQISGETIWRLDATWANLPWRQQVRLELTGAAEAAASSPRGAL